VIAPDVPVTVNVTWDPAVWAFEVAPHPTATIEKSEMKSSNPNTRIERLLLRASGFRLPVTNTVQNRPKAGSKPAIPVKL